MANRYVRFGNALLPQGFAPSEEPVNREIEMAKALRTDGARTITAYQGGKVIPVHGALIDGPIPNLHGQSTLRDAVDALLANLAEGPADLYFWDDRYYRQVQAGPVSISYGEKRYHKIAFMEIQFQTGDPFGYALTESSDVWTPVSGTHIITPGGNAYTLPTYTIKTASTSINWTITNSTTGEYFTLVGSGLTVGDDIEVDCQEQTVEIDGTDYMSLFDGLFPKLNSGTNSLTTTQTTGSITSITTTYRNRWRA